MKNTRLALAALMLFAFPLTHAAKTDDTKVELQDSQGKSVGTAVISQKTSGVAIRLDLHGLPPGEHATHFRQNPPCTTPDFNPDQKKPGFMTPEGHPAGKINTFT